VVGIVSAPVAVAVGFGFPNLRTGQEIIDVARMEAQTLLRSPTCAERRGPKGEVHVKIMIQALKALTVTVVAFIAIVVVVSLRSGSPTSGVGASGRPSALPSVLVPKAFVIVSKARPALAIRSSTDCATVSDPWLKSWCVDTVSYDPTLKAGASGNLLDANPADVGGDNFPAFEQRVQGAMAWGVIHGDLSVCDLPEVILYVDAGSHGSDGANVCRTSLNFILSRGWLSVSNPSTGESLFVGLKPAFVGVLPSTAH
jgi:hypothetical protein